VAIAQCSKNQLLHELLVRIRGVLQEFIDKSSVNTQNRPYMIT
jgi:DNA-binding FadR family transcriptional regulator